MENRTNSRWWETYLVRYITGSVVGAVIVYQILSVSDVTVPVGFPKWFELKAETLMLLGAIGFAYCYIASAPITFLHAIRVGGEGTSRASILLPITLVISVPILLMLMMNYVSAHVIISSIILFAFLAAAWILIGLNIVKYPNWARSYENVVSARSSTLKDSPEFVDSYRHLREHGNAFYIVIMELLLAIPLYIFSLYKDWFLFVVAVGVWLVPGAICWYLGNTLEKFMTDKHKQNAGKVP